MSYFCLIFKIIISIKFEIFRFSNRFRVNNTDYRVLYKAFGLRFIISVSGTAGKFDGNFKIKKQV